MKVFISHSFQDAAAFDNVVWVFKNENIDYWDPIEVRSGTVLSDQLRQAILSSAMCVFIATRRSVESPWCSAELGAFWGAGKKVLVYLADSELAESALPRQLQGHFFEQRIPRLVEHVKASLAELETPHEEAGPTRGFDTKSKDLRDTLDAAFSRALIAFQLREAFDRLSQLFVEGISTLPQDKKALLTATVVRLLNRRPWEVSDAASEFFPFSFEIKTSTGSWSGYAQTQQIHGLEHAPDVFVQQACVLLKFNDERRWVTAAAITERVVEGHNRGVTGTAIDPPIVQVGLAVVGTAVRDQHH